MQEMMRIVISLELFALCVAAAFWFFGTELGIIAIRDRSLDLEALQENYNATAQTYQTDPFNIALVFGDFGRAITQFMQAVATGELQELAQRWGFVQIFLFGFLTVIGLLVIMTLIYLVSGRG